nr:MAG TPA: zinc-ribbon domain protein [Caudoviricetes sp.]
MAEKEYIDRNELIDDFQNDLINLHFNGLKGTPRPKEIKIVNVIERIEDFPAADVAPVKHGRWIRPHWKNNNYCCDCSECGGEAMHRDYRWDKNGVYPICPNCGAKMTND